MSQPMLARLMFQDLSQNKLRLMMVLAVMASALWVVELAYENRQLTAELDELKEQSDALNIEWRHLMLEEGALAEHSRIGRIAARELNMVRPSVERKTLVDVQ